MPGWLVTALAAVAVVLIDRNRATIWWWTRWTYHRLMGHHK